MNIDISLIGIAAIWVGILSHFTKRAIFLDIMGSEPVIFLQISPTLIPNMRRSEKKKRIEVGWIGIFFRRPGKQLTRSGERNRERKLVERGIEVQKTGKKKTHHLFI